MFCVFSAPFSRPGFKQYWAESGGLVPLKDLGRSVIRSRAATELLSFHLGLLHKQQPAPSQHLLVFGIFWQFLSIFVMMTVLSKRYVAPLIKALKPRVGYHNISPPYLLDNLKKQNFTDHLKFCCLTILQQRHARTNSRALSLTSENRGKEVPSEADVVVIGKNSSHLSLQVFIANYPGGGSLGCQTLYHLAKLGVTNTVLLEKEQLTAGRCTTRGLRSALKFSTPPPVLAT